MVCDYDVSIYDEPKTIPLKEGLYLHTYICQTSGETIYLVYDDVGAVFNTIFVSELEPYLDKNSS